jgi:hypothetical protein
VKVGLRWVVAGCVALGLIGAIMVVAAWWPRGSPDPYADGPGSPRLVVQPREQGYMLAQMEGTLGVNEQHCVTLDGNVVIAPYGSRVTPDGRHVSFPGWAPIRIGTSLVGGGGYLGGRDRIRAMNWDDDMVGALENCLGQDPDVSVVQFWLSRD